MYPEVLSPFQVLPFKAREYAISISQVLKADVDMVAQCILGVAHLASLGGLEIEVGENWTEPSACFFVTGANSGHRKSPTAKQLETALHHSIDKYLLPDEGEAQRIAAERTLVERGIQALMHSAAKSSSEDIDPEAVERLAALQGKLKTLNPQVSPIICSGTPQAISKMLGKRSFVGVLDPEGGFLPGIRNTHEDQAISILKAWSGDRIRDERVGSGTSASERPQLSTCILWQFNRLARFLMDKKYVENGLTARFLPLFVRKNPFIPYQPVNTPFEDATLWYEMAIEAIVKSASELFRMGARRKVLLSTQAYNEFQAYRNEIDQQISSRRSECWADVLEKAPSHALRLALIIQLLESESVTVEYISGENMWMGIALARFFVDQHAGLRQWSDMGPVRKIANRIISRLPYGYGTPVPFKPAELYRPLGITAFECERALRLLASYGYVRECDWLPPSDPRPGRKEAPCWVATMPPHQMEPLPE